MSRTLVITEGPDGYYTLFDGTSVADRLQDDEALGAVAQFLLKPRTKPGLRYGSVIEDRFEIERRIRADIEAFLRPVDRLMLQEKRDPK